MSCDGHGLPYSDQFSSEFVVIVNPENEALRLFVSGDIVSFTNKQKKSIDVAYLGLPVDETVQGIFGDYVLDERGDSIISSVKLRDFRNCVPQYQADGSIKRSKLTRKECFELCNSLTSTAFSAPPFALTTLDLTSTTIAAGRPKRVIVPKTSIVTATVPPAPSDSNEDKAAKPASGSKSNRQAEVQLRAEKEAKAGAEKRAEAERKAEVQRRADAQRIAKAKRLADAEGQRLAAQQLADSDRSGIHSTSALNPSEETGRYHNDQRVAQPPVQGLPSPFEGLSAQNLQELSRIIANV